MRRKWPGRGWGSASEAHRLGQALPGRRGGMGWGRAGSMALSVCLGH